jgi:hypothetical protein
MNVYVGAYPAIPQPVTADSYEPEVERHFFTALRELEGVRGLEMPFYGTLHQHDVEAYLDLLDPEWSYVISGLPGTMMALREDPHFGLASHAKSGRTAALEFCRRLRAAVATLQRRFGPHAVRRVELHTAPRQGAPGVAASTAALVDSLREVRGWDWLGAKLAIEHCDAYVPGQPPQKGFLSIAQELDALEATQDTRTQTGMLLNWARSAIEGRDAAVPLAHLREAKRRGLLVGLMFSGVCASDPTYGDWQDTHAPFAPAFGVRHTAERSILTAERGRAWLAEGGAGLDVVGLKIQPLPATIPLEERIEYVRDAIRWLRALGE